FIRKNAKGIVLGTKILLQTLGVKRAVLAVNSRDEDVVEAFTPYISEKGMIVFAPVAPKYPQGNEHLLISSIYKIEVPLTSPTEKSGYAVFSAETIFNIYDCLINTRAVINKAVTVTGDAIYKNENLYITIGSQFSEALAHCDGFKETDHTIINGGILNGIETDENDFISPTTNEIIALKQKEPKNGQCVRCSRCSMVCPIHLAPYRLSENYLNGKHDENLAIGLYNCIECGCCSFVCIGNVDILGNIRNDKACITPLEQENEKKSNYNKLGKMRAFFGKKTKEVSPSKADAIKVALQGISLDPIPDESKSESDFEDISETSSQTLQKILQETTADSTDETKNDSYAHTNFDKNKTANLFIPGEDDIDELDTEKDQQIEYDTKIYGADDDK
ncbi:MAG: 4Fe-4S dicluster domain-containing protein, partial [Clostridia bacterium]